MQQTDRVLDCQLHHTLTAHHIKKDWSGIGAARNTKFSRLDRVGLSAAPQTHSSPHYHRRKKAWSGVGLAGNIKCSRRVECWTVCAPSVYSFLCPIVPFHAP